MIEQTVAEMYRDDDDNRFLEVTYQNGDKEILYYRDFASGAMIENIVRRAKKLAIKRVIAGESPRHPHRGPARVDPPGVQGERGPAQHHEPRRLGADLGQEGRADRLRPHPAHRRPRGARRPLDRAGRYRPVPLEVRVAPWPSPRSAASRPSTASIARARAEPDRRVVGARQRLRRRRRAADRLGLRGRDPGQRRPRLRPRGLAGAHGRDPPGQHRAHQRRPLLRRPRPPRVLDPRVPDAAGVPASTTRRGRRCCARAMAAAALRIPDQPAPVVYKNNSDGKGNSYGCHENYMMDRAVPFAKVVDGVVPALRHAHALHRARARSAPRRRRSTPTRCEFQISQRAEFFEEIVGLETTLKRPIVNTRDEPHADPEALPAAARDRRRRQPVRGRDLLEGRHARRIVLAMVEDDAGPARDLSLADPVRAHAPGVGRPRPAPAAGPGRRLDGHRARDAVGALRRGPQVRRGARPRGAGRRRRGRRAGPGALGGRARRRCETDPASLADTLDWVAKRRASRPTRTATAAAGSDPRLAALACSTTTCGPERPSSARLGMRALVDAGEVAAGGHRAAARAPGPGSGARAWPGGPTPSSRPTGIRWSSTSAQTRCGASL